MAELEGLTLRLLPLDKLQLPQAGTDDLFYRATWRKSVRAAANPQKNRTAASWLVFEWVLEP